MITIFVIHLGQHFPHYIKDCLHQIRLHNSKDDVDIILLVNKCNMVQAELFGYAYDIKPAYVEDLPKQPHYEEFLQQSRRLLDLAFRQKYSQYILERYFVWEAYLLATPLPNTYFIETDNLLYANMKTIQKTEALFAQDMAMPFDTVERGTPSFIFARHQHGLNHFNTWIVNCMKKGMTDDMDIYGLYRLTHPDKIFPYPVLPAICNANITQRTNLVGQIVPAKDCAFLCDERFPILFDPIAYGQAVSGIDPRNTNAQQSIGHINIKTLFSVNETQLGWAKMNNLWIPVANGVPIANLHIHSKALVCFLSDRETVPTGDYNPVELLNKIQNDYRK